MKQVTITCDGCGKQLGFERLQLTQERHEYTEEWKLMLARDHHFCDLPCLAVWLPKAWKTKMDWDRGK